jgi:hypothetical protein
MKTIQKILIAVLRFVFVGLDQPKRHKHKPLPNLVDCMEGKADDQPTELHGEQYY